LPASAAAKFIISILGRKSMRKIVFLSLVFFLSWVVIGQAVERPQKWAVPVQSRYLKNFFQLDPKVYRSAQPSRRGFEEAKRLGITDVLNLRDNHTDKSEANDLGLTLHQIKAEADEINQQEIISALRTIRFAKGPVLVHCWRGSDRTGAVCAMYRIIFNNWSKEEAIDEMVNGGFGYHKMYENIVQLIREVDIEKIKSEIFSP
jgi:tyrosine-protein phosphatase SIW14